MEEVSLTETESRYYGDLFLCCDEEKTGKIPMLKASELYRSANLSNEKILEITSLAGIPDTALHVSRVQFYSCLKLIAAHQASMPLRQELIAASVQLPLPRFSWAESSSNKMEMANTYQQHHHTIPPPPVTDRRNSLKRLYEWSDANALGSRRNSSATHQPEISAVNSDVPSTDSEVEQGESSCGGEEGVAGVSGHNKHHRRGVSPEAWSTNSDSPTPTNSVAERPWAKETLWHGLLGDEHRQLLGTEEESSDRHSSDDENETDLETVYQITPEQREYYFKQFKAVQHDPNGLLSGQVARVFFEKSRIPVEELRHIWQLCDVTRDGALSLAEFTAAMHLVVLRRNNIPLPATLPVCLHPNVLQHTALGGSQMTSQADPPEADLLHLDDDDDEDNTDNTIIGVNATINAAVAVGANSGGRGLNENNVMNLSTLSTSSQASVSSRQGSNAITSNPKSLTPPPLPLKLHSISNSPKVTPPPLPLKLQSISNSPTGGGVNAATSSPSSNLWAKDVQPNQWTIPPLAEATEVTAPTSSPPPIMWAKDVQPNKWTKFNESPTSNVSSPGPKPVNFDMQRTAQAVVSDPQILHPVPLRVTPVAGGVITSTAGAAEKHNNDVSDGAGACVRESSPKSSSVSSSNSHGSGVAGTTQPHRDSLQNNDLRAIQRPQAKKLPIKNIGAIPPPPQREPITAGNIPNAIGDHDAIGGIGSGLVNNNLSVSMLVNKKEPPPLPPPRPHRHGRSSSLDLNKFKIGTPSEPQPEIIAQASFDLQTSTGFADFTHFTDGNIGTGVNDLQPQQMHSLPPQNLAGRNLQTASGALPPTRLSLQSNQRVSAFEVYRKPNTPRNSQSPTSLSANASGVPPIGPAPTPFGSVAATAMTTATALPNSELYEKRVNAISETLRHVSFKQEHNNNNMTEVLRHLREQNNLLLRLCNDLSDELLTVQTRKEEMRLKLEATSSASNAINDGATLQNVTAPTMAPVGHTGGVVRTGSSISAPVTANITGGSGSSGVHSNV
ncbi:uncharacterized protein LOC119603054 isoform X1 [Lucilia sericata]|uniref:uncharacterized protein LOC119603054 isoform X1 n=1 Tax=Lucilia sericata TaxID=13632 RepID=UPI0018A80A09|nr:uncharacterized protein LOC119603054 isoform X1 [Lucilia sericata]XP_037810858.1 uncharacterized protein LOC119603054 isoform X1 [Lucilia sericata]XP_037810866.1 uncharacterized protein LOC119603054 isoform X1 [Lucilia sericata]XP_037810876.1 uncharacterized protein LOC119603054 isoform X1 [Lucilia sericata]